MPGRMRRWAPALRPVAVLAVIVVLASFAWTFFATPPRLDMTEQGLIFGSEQLERRFGVMVVYLAIGAVAGLLWGGWALRVLGRIFGPAVVGVYLVLLTAAGAATDHLGVLLGPSDPREADPTSFEVGQSVSDALALENPVFWLIWPVSGLIALVVVLYWQAEPLHAEERDD